MTNNMTGPDCAVMCNSINTHRHRHIHHWEDQGEWDRMTRITKSGCAVMWNLNTHTHTHTHTHTWGRGGNRHGDGGGDP